ncbi:MAG: rhodanese-like domain-containing protein [Burkholderiales bacterium]
MKRWILGLALAAATSTAMAQSIVDLDYVRQAVARGALLWDVRDAKAYAKGHIPGAINFGDPAVKLRNTYTEDYLPLADIEKALGAAGIDPAREIVVYGSRGLPSAYFAQVTLRYFGATNARVFHDGIDGWRAGGQPVSTRPFKAKPVELKLVPQPGVIVETKEVVAALKRSDVQILDVRSVREFKGEDVRAIRGGHIPGAINIPFEQNWVDPDILRKLKTRAVKDTAGLALKPREELTRLYGKLDPAKETLVYCQSGGRAAETAVVLGDLGFKNVKVYDASWLGYSSWLSAPAEDEVWANFGALLTALKVLEDRYGQLVEKRPATRTR